MSENFFINTVAEELNIDPRKASAAAELLDQGATVPFIARYRKEATGSLDEVAITAVRDRLRQIRELASRKETVLGSLEKNGHLTDELQQKIENATTLAEVEDIYLPYRPRRRTRAVKAREKGLEPLAGKIFAQEGIDVHAEAEKYADPEKGVSSAEQALAGARDIIAETINESKEDRARLRQLFSEKAVLKSRVIPGMEEKGAVFKDYFDWQEPAASVPSHRMLAVRRGEDQGIVSMSIQPDAQEAVGILEELFVKGSGEDSGQVKTAARDAYKRLLSGAMETEARLNAKQKADQEAIGIFAQNLRQVLLSPPLGAKRIMAVDPGYRTGCKIACLDRQGKLLHHETIYPHTGSREEEKAQQKVKSMCDEFSAEAVAVGNGTAGRETEAFIKKINFGRKIPVVMVDESGASVYSASEAARREFADLDLTVRGAVSIGRRLMDPLAELVKIDPKSIGVGQYQHDVDQRALKQALDDVVTSCVNAVGVDANRASRELLTYVSGLSSAIAENIVSYRDENGPFKNREELKNVPRLGPRTFEQCAGFLRIYNGENPLDASAVHPESYPLVRAMAEDLGAGVEDLIKNQDLRKKIDLSRYVTDTAGMPTLKDIIAELARPGRDIREKFEEFSFAEGVEKIEDLEEGMRLAGIVTNITAFGAFVDIGVHRDGLVHISEMADRFVKNPADVVSVRQKVNVRVLSVDLSRNRISLSMKG